MLHRAKRGWIEVADALADAGVRVIVVGIDMDFRGEPFGPMGLLLARAERMDAVNEHRGQTVAAPGARGADRQA